MTLRRLERSEWRGFLDQASRTLLGRSAEIEVDSLELGSQVLARPLPLLGILYDTKKDVVEIALDGFDHAVHRPRELYVDGPPFGWATLSVTDAEGVLRIVTLRAPLLLPPARD